MKKLNRYFVTGTGTDIGKTIVTTLLTAYLNELGEPHFPYKPVQSGADKVQGKLVAPDINMYANVIPLNTEIQHTTYVLETPSSPHFAAEKEQIQIDMDAIFHHIQKIKEQYHNILIEGAGGLYVPLTNDGYCMIDLMKEISYPVILVAEAGLGTINHTVLSVKALQEKEIVIAGIILNGVGKTDADMEQDNRKMIETLTNVPVIGTVPYVSNIEEMIKDPQKRGMLTKDWQCTRFINGGKNR